MIANIRRALRAAGERVSEELTAAFREHAIGQGWDPETAGFVSVRFDLDTTAFVFETEPSSEMAVFDSEYGCDEEPPRPAMRTFDNRIDEIGSPRLDAVLHEELVREGVI